MNLTKSRTAKLAAGVVGFAMAVTAFAPALVSADTASDLQAQINSLLATISSLQAQLSATTGGSVSTGYVFNTNLTVGSTGTDVMNLQKVLNMSADTKVAASGVGSPGMESTYFGGLTKAAVMKFQTKYGISPVAGYVGPITRAKLNTMSGTVVTNPGTGLPTGGALSVSAGAQPSNSLAPLSAARIPFTTVVLTAGAQDVTVNSITVERTGLAQDAAIASVSLLKSDGTQIGIAKTLNSNHQAMVGEPFVVKAGTSMTVTVAANRQTSDSSAYAGQVLALNVVAVNTSASVVGAFPITGAMHTINSSLTIGTAAMTESSFDPDTSSTKEIGTTGYKFAGVRVTAGSAEQVRLWSIRWNQTGSASSGDLANIMVYVDGVAYPTTVSTDGKYYTASFSGGLLIDKGLAKDVYIQGDIVGSGASGRTVIFDLYRAVDVYVSGVTYGYGITPTQSQNGTASESTSEFTSGTPFFSGSKVTISSGSVTTIQKATSVAAQNIAINVPNQVLGGFTTDIKGEPLSAQGVTFYFNYSAGTAASSNLLTSVSLVDSNGAVVAGPVDAQNVGGVAQKVTFSDTINLPVGQKTYTLKGKVPSSVTTNGVTIVASTTPSADWSTVTGQTTGNTIASANLPGVFTMNTMTIRTASLAVAVSASPASQFIVAGAQGLTLANYQLDASQSGEDVRFSSVVLTNGGTLTSSGNLTSCQLWDGSVALNTGSNVVNPSSATPTVTFDQTFVVPKGTVKTLALKCNVATGITGTAIFGITGTQIGNISATGVTSGGTVTATGSTATGQTMTIASGSLAVTIDSSTSNYSVVASGSTGVTIGTFKFRATNEAVNLSKIGLVLSTSTAADVGTVSLYNGAPLIGTATFTGSNTIATSTLNGAGLALAKDTDVLITIKADLANIGSSETGTEGRLVKIDVTNAEGTGVASGATLQVGGVTAGVNGVRMFRSYPTVSSDTLATTGVADGKLMRFKITASPSGPVGIFSLDFSIATSSFSTGGGVTNPKVMVYSDSSYSLPVSGNYGVATGQFGSNGFVGSATNAGSFTASTTGSYVPLQIPAGTTYYFQVEATVSSVTTGTSVTTTLNGDSAYIASANLPLGTVGPTVPLVSSTTGAIADTNNDFIWSGNATSTAVTASLDWANGYGISGLPSGGISTTRSQ